MRTPLRYFIKYFLIYATLALGPFALAVEAATPPTDPATTAPAPESPLLSEFCESELSKIPGQFDRETLKKSCAAVQQLDECQSELKRPIFHYERVGTDKAHGKRVLTFSLIHGDELPSGSVSRAWINRLSTIDPRNTWRVIPIVNPDGVLTKTRYNSNKIDLNRNFPSKDWDAKALSYWKSATKKDPRRFPGHSAASESETRCLIKHIAEFKPDFIISVHTPLGVLDFDGPRVSQPGFKPLPWVGLGNYSGSLGRYMWVDRKVPVLTIELKGNVGMQKLEDFDRLQDISGTVAIQAGKMLEQKKQ